MNGQHKQSQRPGVNGKYRADYTPPASSNYPSAGWTDDHQEELRAVIHQEYADLQAGREEDLVMMKALADNWSAAQLRDVAKRRGRNWRFLTPLTDQILQAEGWALLIYAASAIGGNLGYLLLVKWMNLYDRVDRLMEKLIELGKMDARRMASFERFFDFLDILDERSKEWYLQNLARLISRESG